MGTSTVDFQPFTPALVSQRDGPYVLPLFIYYLSSVLASFFTYQAWPL